MSEAEIKVVNYPKGAAIVVQHAINPGLFYIVRSGKVAVDSEHIQVDHELTNYNPGDSFGLVSALTEHHFLVTLFAQTDVELLQIPIRMLGSFLKGNKDLAMKILRLYSHELRALQRNLSRANQPADRVYLPEKLILNAKTYMAWQKPALAAHSLYRYLEWADSHQTAIAREEAESLLQQLNSSAKPYEWTSQKASLEAGEILFVESEMNQDIFVVLEGTVKLFSIVRGFEYVIDVLGVGEIFGEMGLIDNAPRMASAVTETPSVILRVTPENIFESVGESLMQKVFESIARRIWFSHQRLIILRMQLPEKRLYAFLYNSIRDQDIRKGTNLQASYASVYSFPIAFEELCSMCGIIKVKKETIQDFLSDSNIIISKDRITVKSRKRIEEKLGHYKTKQGQIIAKLI